MLSIVVVHCFVSPLDALTGTSGTVKNSPQGGNFQVSSSSGVLDPVSEVMFPAIETYHCGAAKSNNNSL